MLRVWLFSLPSVNAFNQSNWWVLKKRIRWCGERGHWVCSILTGLDRKRKGASARSIHVVERPAGCTVNSHAGCSTQVLHPGVLHSPEMLACQLMQGHVWFLSFKNKIFKSQHFHTLCCICSISIVANTGKRERQEHVKECHAAVIGWCGLWCKW